jgi:DNA-binding transcriptional LysR family regulator
MTAKPTSEAHRKLTIAASEPLRFLLTNTFSSIFDVETASDAEALESAVAAGDGVVLLHEDFLGKESGWELARRLTEGEPRSRLIVLFESKRSYRFLDPARDEFVPVETAELPMTEDALHCQLMAAPPELDMSAIARARAERR